MIESVRKQTNRLQETLNQAHSPKIEIIDIDQAADELQTNPNNYFTPEEMKYCHGRTSGYAVRLAGKIAIKEILGQKAGWQDIEIKTDQLGRPIINLKRKGLCLARGKGIQEIQISLSHGAGLAIAFAMGTTSEKQNLRLGTDVVSVARIANVYNKHQSNFLGKIYSNEEIGGMGTNSRELAIRWAAKESVAKALGTGIGKGVGWKDISILANPDGTLFVKLTGGALAQAQEKNLKNWEIHNIIYDDGIAIAFAIAC